ncbi:MAG TPA: tetratricopeptide repeat protein [Drouetiella sp.]|jgi:tetratricopeptide (TPR) repeat protein
MKKPNTAGKLRLAEWRMVGAMSVIALAAIEFAVIPELQEPLINCGFFHVPPAMVVASGIAGGIVLTAYNLVSNIYLKNRGWNKLSRPLWSLPPVLAAAFVAPLSEEIVFRGVLQNEMGILVASLAFTLAHLRQVSYWNLLLSKLPTGLILGGLLLATHNIWTCIIAHTLNNCWFMFRSYSKSRGVVRAIQANLDGEKEKALRLLTAEIDKKPDAYTLRNRASIYLHMGEYEKALADTNLAIEKFDTWSRIIRAEVSIKRKNYEEATKDLTICLKQLPKDPYAHRVAARLHQCKNEFRESLAHYKKAFQLSKSTPDLHNYLQALYLVKDYAECLKESDKALVKNPKNFWLMLTKSTALLALEQIDQALKVREETIAIANPTELPTAYAFKAEILEQRGQHEEALELCNKALEISPKNFYAYAYRAISNASRGKFDEAASDIESARKEIVEHGQQVFLAETEAEIQVKKSALKF